MLDNFFRINMPYGIRRVTGNRWMAFNREYMPLGWNSTENQESIFKPVPYETLPIHTAFDKLTDKVLLSAAGPDGVMTDDDGQIVTIFFYSDATNPTNFPTAENWKAYFDKIKKLSVLKTWDSQALLKSLTR